MVPSESDAEAVRGIVAGAMKPVPSDGPVIDTVGGTLGATLVLNVPVLEMERLPAASLERTL